MSLCMFQEQGDEQLGEAEAPISNSCQKAGHPDRFLSRHPVIPEIFCTMLQVTIQTIRNFFSSLSTDHDTIKSYHYVES
jgi:hypothetical protein